MDSINYLIMPAVSQMLRDWNKMKIKEKGISSRILIFEETEKLEQVQNSLKPRRIEGPLSWNEVKKICYFFLKKVMTNNIAHCKKKEEQRGSNQQR
jgi:hypothetical protein